MVAEDSTVYAVCAGLLGLIWSLIVVVALQYANPRRNVVLISSIPAAAMCIAYVMLHFQVLAVDVAGRQQSVLRFVGYSIALLSIVYLLHLAISMPRRLLIKLGMAILLAPWVTMLTWFLTGPVESLASALSLGLFAYGAYLLYRPIARVARSRMPENRLYYMKIAHLFVLCYIALILGSIGSQQVTGLMTPFVSAMVVGYIDMVFMTGVGFLTISSVAIFNRMGGQCRE